MSYFKRHRLSLLRSPDPPFVLVLLTLYSMPIFKLLEISESASHPVESVAKEVTGEGDYYPPWGQKDDMLLYCNSLLLARDGIFFSLYLSSCHLGNIEIQENLYLQTAVQDISPKTKAVHLTILHSNFSVL